MADILQQIKELETSLKEARNLLKTCSGEIEKLKSDKTADQQKLSDKDTELKELRSKLLSCNQSKEEIQEALNNKVIELENSDFSNEEKKDQIIKLLTKNGFANICKELVETWANYAKSRDEVVELMKERDKHAYEAINAINDTKKNQWRIIWGLLILVVVLSLSLSLSVVITNTSKKKGKSKVKSIYK